MAKGMSATYMLVAHTIKIDGTNAAHTHTHSLNPFPVTHEVMYRAREKTPKHIRCVHHIKIQCNHRPPPPNRSRSVVLIHFVARLLSFRAFHAVDVCVCTATGTSAAERWNEGPPR